MTLKELNEASGGNNFSEVIWELGTVILYVEDNDIMSINLDNIISVTNRGHYLDIIERGLDGIKISHKLDKHQLRGSLTITIPPVVEDGDSQEYVLVDEEYDLLEDEPFYRGTAHQIMEHMWGQVDFAGYKRFTTEEWDKMKMEAWAKADEPVKPYDVGPVAVVKKGDVFSIWQWRPIIKNNPGYMLAFAEGDPKWDGDEECWEIQYRVYKSEYEISDELYVANWDQENNRWEDGDI